jgi:heme A synthase
MTTQPTRVRVLRLAVLLTALFVVMALVVLVRDTPIAFTVFMFVGQPLFLVALTLLLGAVLADLRAKQLL